MWYLYNGILAIKNEIIPFAAAQMDLEIIILNEVKEEKTTSYDIIYIRNLKKDTNELICRRETDSKILKTNLWLPKGTGRWKDGLKVWDWPMHTEVME